MGQLIANVFSFLRQNALKVVATLGISIIFFITFFPAEDLSDLATNLLAKNTGVYFQSDRLDVSFIPSPGIEAESVVLEAGQLPPLKAMEVNASVSLLNAILFRLGASANANGLFGGELSLDLSEGEKLKSGQRVKSIIATATGLNLESVSDYMLNAGMSGALNLQGLVNLTSSLSIDTLFEQQPKGSLNLDINNFTFPGQTMMFPFNGVMVPQPMPEMKFGKLTLKSEMNDGNLDIQSLSFGGPGSDVSGKIKGQLGLQIRSMGGAVIPIVGRYDLNIDFTLTDDFFRSNETLLGPLFDIVGIKAYRQDAKGGSRYVFRIRPDQNGMPQTSTPQ